MKRSVLSFLAVLALGSASPMLAADEADLRARLATAEAERLEAERALETLRNEAGPLLDELAGEQLRLNEELDAARRQLLRVQSTTVGTQGASQQAEADLANARAQVSELETRLRREREDFAQQLNRMREERDELETTGVARRAAAEQAAAVLLNRMETTAGELEAARALSAQIAQERDDILGLNEQLQGELGTARREVELTRAQFLALEARVHRLQGELNTAQTARVRAEQERDQLARRVGTLETEVQRARENAIPPEEMEQLQEALQQAQGQNQQLEERLQAAEARPDLSTELEQAMRQRDLLEAQLKTMQTRVADAEAARELAENENRDLAQNLDRARQDLRHLEHERTLMSDELEAARQHEARANRMTQSNQALLDHLGKVEQERKALQEDLEQAQADLREAGDLQTMSAEIEEVQEILKHLATENQRLQESLSAETEAMEVLSADMMAARHAYESELRELESLLGASMRELNLMRNRVVDLEREGARAREIEAANQELQAARERARQDMRVLARHIQNLRRQREAFQQRESEYQREREALIQKIMELEARQAIP